MINNIPEKIINNEDDLKKFLNSDLYKELIKFVIECQSSIKSKSISDTKEYEKFNVFDNYFKELEIKLKETPPIEDKMRFGNIAFKDFHSKAIPINNSYCNRILVDLGYKKDDINTVCDELVYYLNECFGSEVRIDYGTGHELNFFVFLFCLNLLGLVKEEEFEFLVRNCFYKYINLMRKIQLQYNLEPAGSHGVWGLDDYHFLPFLFGASELIDNKIVKLPKDIHNEEIINNLFQDYMYLDCIKFIKKVKTGGRFYETSPILNDISNAQSWQKITTGMVKMYHGEVFTKFPVTRHLRFGKIFNFKTYKQNKN